ncbi:hypothetical protein G6L37_34875 [Agrobacterium rubi]|nr:hypothetical protein [Agrobacterium rubi]NTF23753.1 hypothetical protein [Agrobacterium rubi]
MGTGISIQEARLITRRWIPEIREGKMDARVVQSLTDSIYEGSAPFASFVLNRVAAWLEGGKPFTGDDVLEVSWSRSDDAAALSVFSKKGRNRKEGNRSCTISRPADGASWVVSWGRAEYRDVPEIVLDRIGSAGEKLGIARGEITTGEPDSGNRHRFSDCPDPVKGTVEADIVLGGFDDLWDFCAAVRGSMPDSLLAVDLEETVTFAHLSRLEDIAPIMEADGGLPGRLCRTRHEMIVTIANGVHGHWMRDQYDQLILGLRDRGAVWGNGVISYNDSDYHCCVIDFSDGAVGLFSDNSATCADERAYVAKVISDNGNVSSVEVYLCAAGTRDYGGKIAAIGDGTALPDYVHDYTQFETTTPGGRAGWAAMIMFLWQSMADVEYGLKDGRLNESPSYWGKTEAILATLP